jgi:methionine aminopeptidase
MKATFDGSQESWNQISSILLSFAATYHTPSDQPPYIRLIDSDSIINVGDTVSVDVHITRNGYDSLSVESFIVDDIVYTAKLSVCNYSIKKYLC